MKNTVLAKPNKDIIPIYLIQLIKLLAIHEANLLPLMLEKGLPIYKPGEDSLLSKDELQNYPTKKIPYLIFNKPDLINSLCNLGYERLQKPIDNLPVLAPGDIDEEKTALFIEIRDLRNENKMPPFNPVVFKELEEKKDEYFKKYKKDFSGVIDGADWFWQMRFDFPPPIVRDENKERNIWKLYIQPIVERHNLKNSFGEQFQYEFFKYPETISERNIKSMLFKTMDSCQAFSPKRDLDYFFDYLIKGLNKDIKEVPENIIELKDTFSTLLESLFEENILSYFLEWLDREKYGFDSALQDYDVLIKKKVFPCQPGTKWDDIKITLTANDTVRIETPMGEGRYTYHELGMSDKRPGDKPKEVWVTLVLFAKNQGIFPPKNHNLSEPFINDLIERTKHLNAHLKKLFGIKEPIFKYHYKKYKRYETKIKFSDQTIVSEPEPSQDKSSFDSELDEINKKFGF